MSRITTLMLVLILAIPALSIADWRDVLEGVEAVDKLIVNHPESQPVQESSEASDDTPARKKAPVAPSSRRSGEDTHYIQNDDYFVSQEELGGNTYIYVSLSKMVTRPTVGTKNEGEFMHVGDGQNVWTGFIWKSRIAAKSELKLGMHIIIFEDNQQNEIYQAPLKKDTARAGRWFYAKITDLSDMYKGFVTVSGNYKVGLNNIRIPIPYTSSGR